MESVLSLHITLMVASIILTAGSLVAAACSIWVPTPLRRINLGLTLVGVASGILLLTTAPIGLRCIALTAYVALFWLSARYIAQRSAQLRSVES